MIDTRMHILSGIVDGSETMQESSELAEALAQEGIRAAVATPHYYGDFVHSSAAEIQGSVYELQRESQQHNIPLRNFADHEALIQPGLVEVIQAGQLAELNGVASGQQRAAELVGQEQVYKMLEVWPAAIVNNEGHMAMQLNIKGIGRRGQQ